ncbi:hypothetical protein RD1_1097 [Roseobacter denitrificans OCh 114]|uniref:Uncharacterized protein n=1 Tax=Roseobacter denitrificans (strain ATCC 33942 / OCh 114) TaxID=375451 RepID=Q16B89_ROSDO|nr:hypothetical protein RD1_1097 [Roseobacter denitrificans OCh 114]
MPPHAETEIIAPRLNSFDRIKCMATIKKTGAPKAPE